MQEQMVETREWKVARDLPTETPMCRLCMQYQETVHHLVAGCKVIAGNDYLQRHNNALMIFAVAWGKQEGLLAEETVWYKQKWEKGKVLENEKAKMVWDFEYKLRKSNTARRPDLTLELKNEKKIFICDMSCPQEKNITSRRNGKITKYRQLAFETREKRPGYEVKVKALVIGSLGGGLMETEKTIKEMIGDEKSAETTSKEMQKTVLMESESILRKILSGLIQPGIE